MAKNKNKILVVGGTGFVGEYVAKLLTNRKNLETFVIGAPSNNKVSVRKTRYYEIDLSRPLAYNKIPKTISRINTAIIMTQPSIPITRNILKLLDMAPDLKKIVFVSTILVYPSSTKKIKETTTPGPISQYEKDKMAEENMLTNHVKKRRIRLGIIRMANVYGDKKNRGIIGLIFNSALGNKPLSINGSGDQKRDYIFIEDAANFIKLAALHKQKGQIEIFNVCAGKSHTINKLVKLIKKITGKDILISHAPAVQEKKTITGDNAKIIKLFGKPRYDLFKGLNRSYHNYLSK